MTGVEFEAGDQRYTLRFSALEVARYQKAHGETLVTALQNIGQGEFDGARFLNIWHAGLKSAQPKISEETAAAAIDAITYQRATELIQAAAEETFAGFQTEADGTETQTENPPLTIAAG